MCWGVVGVCGIYGGMAGWVIPICFVFFCSVLCVCLVRLLVRYVLVVFSCCAVVVFGFCCLGFGAVWE